MFERLKTLHKVSPFEPVSEWFWSDVVMNPFIFLLTRYRALRKNPERNNLEFGKRDNPESENLEKENLEREKI